MLYGEGQVGVDDVGVDIISIVLAHQSRRQVNADHLTRTLVDILDQRGETAHEGLVEPRAKETVHHHRVGIERRRVEAERDFRELHLALLHEAVAIGGAVGRQLVMDVKQIGRHLIAGIGEQPRHGKGVAAVVARTGKDDHGRAVGPLFHDGSGEGLGGTLHEIDALYGFVLYRILVKLMYLSSSKYLHTSAKVQKEW